MNDKQFDLYKSNVLKFLQAMERVGGSPTALYHRNIDLLTTLALNGVEISFKVQDVDVR